MEKSMEKSKKKIIFTIFPNLKLQASNQLMDYSEYYFSVQEILLYGFEGLGVVGLFAYVFFRSWFAFLVLLPLAFCFMRKMQNECGKKRKQSLSIQFRELMNSVIAGLYAGQSIENAFVNGYRDMLLLFGKKSYIVRELGYIIKSMKNNINIEDLLFDFGQRSNIDDIRDFAEVFKIAKRSGGDMPAMIRQTADIIADKIEVETRISTVISSKKMEQRIMNIVPFGIILYIDVSSPGFFDSLYHNVTGVAVMSVMTVIYLASYLLAEKITDIKI